MMSKTKAEGEADLKPDVFAVCLLITVLFY
jgi:hypothetical protein